MLSRSQRFFGCHQRRHIDRLFSCHVIPPIPSGRTNPHVPSRIQHLTGGPRTDCRISSGSECAFEGWAGVMMCGGETQYVFESGLLDDETVATCTSEAFSGPRRKRKSAAASRPGAGRPAASLPLARPRWRGTLCSGLGSWAGRRSGRRLSSLWRGWPRCSCLLMAGWPWMPAVW